MLQQHLRRLVAAVALGTALVSVPTGQAGAAACTWQKTLWDLPAGAALGEVVGYDGSRYAVGVTGPKSVLGTLYNRRGTLWDDGKVVLRVEGEIPHLRDVNAAGLVVGDTVVNDRFVAVTIGHDGRTTALPANPAWTGYSAWEVNNAGDVVGWATKDSKTILVVWPANAPGTYREVPTPTFYANTIVDLDEQGRVVVQTGPGGGYVVTAGQWHQLAAGSPDGSGTPYAIRDGRVVGGVNDASYAAAEWDAQGSLVRTIHDGAVLVRSVGGAGTLAGYAFVGSVQRVVLWRGGVVVAQPIPAAFALTGLSDDERTIVGAEAKRPAHYRCS
ncbi:hypothetical protein ACFFQW_41525 [Umezawaea endophytica]|uniref:HAF family extracellular repeat protein n=1 Tax=Umezawaea endophytica TaxID=1654476 RepID=A0A9X3AEG8_9PSEU|nr:hypothetical protein [Umezawaea endophytica]MCS7475875.1 hypothetical protein [Umezawaea endophytica]